MGSKNFRYSLTFALLWVLSCGFGQSNPGFLGKKIAIGYNKQLCLLALGDAFNGEVMKTMTNNDFYIEYALKKYNSISAHVSWQNVLMHSTRDDYVGQYHTYQGETFFAKYTARGTSEFNSISAGIRYSVYSNRKTISAPIGLSQYIRLDVFSNQALKNNFKYEISRYSNINDMENYQFAAANLNTEFDNVNRQFEVTVGYGFESKSMISRTLFFRWNAEMNLSSGILKRLNDEDNYTGFLAVSVKEDMYNLTKELNMKRNLFLVGFGIGALL